MSTLPPKADITERDQDVRFVPKTDKVQRSKIRALFDHLISAGDQRLRHVDRRTTPDHLERRARKKQGARPRWPSPADDNRALGPPPVGVVARRRARQQRRAELAAGDEANDECAEAEILMDMKWQYRAKQRRSTAMIGTNGATDEFIVVARFETTISSSWCRYMANAIQLG